MEIVTHALSSYMYMHMADVEYADVGPEVCPTIKEGQFKVK